MTRRALDWLAGERNFLLFWLGLAALLRLAFVVKTGEGGLSPDSYDWMATAWSIASGEGFGGSWRPPGYAFYLAGVFEIFGKSIIAAKLMNVLLGTATVLLAYLIAGRLFNARTARITAALMSFYPYFIAYAGDLLSETFLTFMIAAAIYAVVRTADKPSWGGMSATGFLIGLAGLTKSVVLPFFVFACAWLWWRTRSFKTGFMTGVFVLLTLAPWTLRSHLYHDEGYFMPVSTPWYSLYGSNHDGALLMETAARQDSPQTDADHSAAIPPDWTEISALPLPERDKICRERALGWIKDNPDKFLWLAHKRALHFWALYPFMAWPWQKYAALATSGIYIPLAAAGLVMARALPGAWLLAGLFLFYTLVHIFFVVTLRYRIPADPYIIMLAAYAIAASIEKFWKAGPDEKSR